MFSSRPSCETLQRPSFNRTFRHQLGLLFPSRDNDGVGDGGDVTVGHAQRECEAGVLREVGRHETGIPIGRAYDWDPGA